MSRTFLLVAGLTDLGGFGRYLGPKQGKSKCFQRIRKKKKNEEKKEKRTHKTECASGREAEKNPQR
jgi:hypothetical protein